MSTYLLHPKSMTWCEQPALVPQQNTRYLFQRKKIFTPTRLHTLHSPDSLSLIPNLQSPSSPISSYLCFHLMFIASATGPLIFYPFYAPFNRKLGTKPPHVPPLFPQKNLLPLPPHQTCPTHHVPRNIGDPEPRRDATRNPQPEFPPNLCAISGLQPRQGYTFHV